MGGEVAVHGWQWPKKTGLRMGLSHCTRNYVQENKVLEILHKKMGPSRNDDVRESRSFQSVLFI